MVERIRIEVCKDLQQCLEDFRRTLASEMKSKYNIDEVEIPRTLSSQVLAAKLKGQNFLEFKIHKRGLNKGVIEL